MQRNVVSTLLDILDLDYLKPIMIHRYDTIDELAQVNLKEIGVRNANDSEKLRAALGELQGHEELLEQFDPILSIHDSDQIVGRIGNEIDLISSSLQLLFDDIHQNLPRDDATSDIDYHWYATNINQIEKTVEQLQSKTNQLIGRFETKDDANDDGKESTRSRKRAFTWFAIAMVSLGAVTYWKGKK